MSAEDVARLNFSLVHERRMLDRNAARRALPITLVSGFLGSGKTSLLLHILKNRLNLEVACAVSDLADINIDALMVSNQTIFQLKKQEHSVEVNALADRSADAVQDIVWKALHESDRPFDYLLVETSGTTDPTKLIDKIQQRFGKMARARLDSVVVVVDGDYVHQNVKSNDALSSVAIRQLECADIVILNKVDLMREQGAIETVKSVLKEHAPLAKIYETTYGQVYLPHILDIAPPEGVYDAISHESVQLHWNTNDSLANTAGRLRVEHAASTASTESEDPFHSVCYEQSTPTSLSSLQDWLLNYAPSNMLRAKGVVYLTEAPTERFVMQVSGKRRLQFESTGKWMTKPQTQFVVIVSSKGNENIQEQLQKCFDSNNHIADTDLVHKIEEDERLQVVEQTDTTISFRLQLAHSVLDDQTLRHLHHVDLDEMTSRLVRDVNLVGEGALLCSLSSTNSNMEKEGVVAMAATTTSVNILKKWHLVDECIRSILDELKHKLATCRCGF